MHSVKVSLIFILSLSSVTRISGIPHFINESTGTEIYKMFLDEFQESLPQELNRLSEFEFNLSNMESICTAVAEELTQDLRQRKNWTITTTYPCKMNPVTIKIKKKNRSNLRIKVVECVCSDFPNDSLGLTNFYLRKRKAPAFMEFYLFKPHRKPPYNTTGEVKIHVDGIYLKNENTLYLYQIPDEFIRYLIRSGKS